MEEDELNSHKCMLPLMRLLDHMEHNKVTPTLEGGAVEMPSWMVPLHRKMNDSKTCRNIRLFVTRLITNRPKVSEINVFS